ncbi:MAG: translocation/assembly module TamB domain-containing protein [Bacteroidales bacterium]|nr:translocation/assembly module TamB domain-containing protein [Bacteroidales bacterium]
MAKSIKKSYKYLFIIAGILIILPTILFSIIRIPAVQTMAVRRITSHISERVSSSISVGSVRYLFFNRLSIDDLLIRDRNSDTLIYAAEATLFLRKSDLKNGRLRFGRITVSRPVVSFITDSTGEMNLQWYLELLRSPGGSKSMVLSISEISVTDGKFSLVNTYREKSLIATDFNNLNLNNINGTLEDFLISDDTTRFNITELSFIESAGFTVKEMNCGVRLAKNDLLFHGGTIKCDSSLIEIEKVGLIGDSASSFSDFTRKVRMDISLGKSLVSSSDLKYFVPPAEKVNEAVRISGKVSGTVAELRGRDIDISFGELTSILCDFDVSGLPDIDNSFIYLGISRLRTSAAEIGEIETAGKKKIVIPELFNSLGTITFNGSFTGFLSDFVAYGNLRSESGTLSTDVSVRPGEKNSFRLKGFVRGSGISLGRLLDNPEMFGNLAMRADIDGYASPETRFSGNISGRIDSIELNSYIYRNVSLNGRFSEKTWDGDISINDRNIRFDVLGTFDFSRELPEFDFSLNLAQADLYRLNFDKDDTTSHLSLLATANFRGTNIDNLDGEIRLLNSTLRRNGNTLDMYDFSVKAFTENGRPAISLRTDFADADLRGVYSFQGLGSLVKRGLASMMPSKFIPPELSEEQGKNNFSFSINLKNTDKLNSFFRTGLLVAEKSSISGSVLSDTAMILNAASRSVSYGGFTFKNLTLDAGFESPELNMRLGTSAVSLPGQTELKGFNASLGTVPDNFIFRVNWDNREEVLNKGDFTARGSFTGSEVSDANPVLNIRIDPTEVYSRNKLWKLSPAVLGIDTSSVMISKLYISNGDNYYLIDGKVSSDRTDTLHLQFRGIDISWLNGLMDRNKKEDQLSLSIKGMLNGNVFLSDLFNRPLAEGDLTINRFSVLQADYGDLSVNMLWNSDRKVADIHAYNNLQGRKMIDVTGNYDPTRKAIDISATAEKLPLDALNPLLKFFASGITGTGSGKVRISGETKNLNLEGAVMAENSSLKVDYLQTRYRLNDSIRFTKDGINFRNIRVTDERGNSAVLNGAVRHNHLKDYRADLTITTNETMVLNTRPKDNDLFYGTAFATGVTTIKSGPESLSFDVSAKTGRNTKFYIPLNSSETVSDYSFITFVTQDTSASSAADQAAKPLAQNTSGIELKFDLEVTPDAEVQLIFDPKVGDIMKGHGSGNLNISLNREGEFKISGDYIIEDGDYLFTLKNILNKPFSVEEGGRISFNGDIDNAEIEMKAIYKLKASLYEILKDENYREKIPVECQINLSGKLFNPVVSFNIYLPMADEETRTYLKNVITTEEELSRQFLYLLVMNSFYADPSYGSSLTSTTTTGTSAMAVTTTEMLSNQLSNWLSQISNDFDIGVSYIPGQKNFNDQEVQVALSTQLLDDRVVINGNLDVRGTGGVSDNTDQLTGDFDIEYKPKFSDKIRFKVFNRFNNPYTGKQSQYTQGFGIFFRQEFDKFSDLFKRKKKPETPKIDDRQSEGK